MNSIFSRKMKIRWRLQTTYTQIQSKTWSAAKAALQLLEVLASILWRTISELKYQLILMHYSSSPCCSSALCQADTQQNRQERTDAAVSLLILLPTI